MDLVDSLTLRTRRRLPNKETSAAADTLFTALYDELHRMARRELARRGAGVTLGATTLLHEAYLDISDREGAAFPDRNRFMGYAARVMRGLIIDYARRRQAQKRGGQFEITSIATDLAEAGCRMRIELGAAQRRARRARAVDARLARIVDLKFFCGFSFAEIAAMIGRLGADRCSATGKRRASTCTASCGSDLPAE